MIKKLFGRIFRFFYNIFLKILSFIFKLIPMKDRVYFYSIRNNGSLMDNAKCVYDTLECDKLFTAKMLPHSYFFIPKIYYYLLTSKVIVTDDYLKYLRYVTLRKKQKVIQIWHACGAFKKFGLDAPSLLPRAEEIKTHSRYDAVCVSSQYVRKFYAGAFGIEESKVIPTGVPRTDILFDEKNKEKMKVSFFSKYPGLQNKKIYLFCPTFREKDGKAYAFDLKIDFRELSKELNEDEVFILKRHPVMKDRYFKEDEFSNIFDMSHCSAIELMNICSVIITDYSSVIFEGALMKKPMVFYCPDFEIYERSFYLDYPGELPGEMIASFSELLPCIRKAKYDNLTEEFIKKELSACDGKSTQRVTELITDFLKN